MATTPDRIKVTNDVLAQELQDAGKRLIALSMSLREGFEVDATYRTGEAFGVDG